jgi:hypothetical protein
MKKRYDKKGVTKQLVAAKCRGYRFGTEILFAKNHQELVMVDPHHMDWPQCNACHKAAFALFSKKNFSVLKATEKPKKIRDIQIVLKYLDQQLELYLGSRGHNVVVDLHIKLLDTYITILEEYYAS